MMQRLQDTQEPALRGRRFRAGSFLEPLIVYLILFSPGIFSGEAVPVPQNFSMNRELFRFLSFTLPSLAILGCLLKRVKNLSQWGLAKPKGRDILVFLFTLPLLFFMGWAVSFLAHRITPLPPPPQAGSPGNLLQWLVLAASCIGTGYLEEGYFRFYLFKTLGAAGISGGKILFLSVFLFSLCHAYEGPWGMANAALAGLLLGLVFKSLGTLHAIAWAHGAYNMLVYLIGS
ncbi:MAG: CPBP family intramembrane metalloprotease [Treponema sp.]|jgi:membrane protease YdiL (CAAX protease family)|nr:CPBP family intramembrane metalloprotease [Treponema sp.]